MVWRMTLVCHQGLRLQLFLILWPWTDLFLNESLAFCIPNRREETFHYSSARCLTLKVFLSLLIHISYPHSKGITVLKYVDAWVLCKWNDSMYHLWFLLFHDFLLCSQHCILRCMHARAYIYSLYLFSTKYILSCTFITTKLHGES
jgi:hypothetical protein